MTTSVLNPKATLNIIAGATISTVESRRVLIIGQQLAGSAVDGALNEAVNSLTNAQVNALFGRSSHVAGLVRSAQSVLSGITPQPQLDVIALDDAVGTKATTVITITGAATADGTIDIIVGSKTKHTFNVAIANADDVTTIAAAIVSAITADLDAPFTAGNVAGVVTITAENFGTIPNTWGVGFEGAVAGVVVTLTSEWAGGATDPTLTSVFDVISDIRETTIIWPGAYALATLSAELDSRFNVNNDVLDGVGVSVIADTPANLKSAVSALNSPSVVVLGNSYNIAGGFLNKKGPGIFEFNDDLAVKVGIIRALRLTEDASITQFVNSAGAPSDAFGGKHISSKPYHNTILPGVTVPAPGEYFTQVEQADLVANAVSVLGANRASNAVVLGTVVTTYLTDTAGNPDTAFKFLNTMDQISIIREFYAINLRSRYAQSRLTAGPITAGFALENEASIRGFCIQLYQELSADVITQSGNVALQAYKDSLVVTIDVALGQATITQAPLLVGQVRAITGTIQVNFGG